MRMIRITNVNINGVQHERTPWMKRPYRPACFNMLRTVGSGRSFLGWGTVTLPGLVGCLNWWCEPTTCTKYQPSALSCLRMSVLFTVRILHTNTQ